MSAADSSPPVAKMASRSTTGTHVFEVPSYSFHRCLDAGCFVRSDTFHIGRYAWSICFHPGGDAHLDDSGDYAAVSLELMTKGAVVEVSYDMALVDVTTGERWFGVKSEKAELDARTAESFCRWCLSRFKRRTELESSAYLHDDRVMIECTLTVIKGSHKVPNLARWSPIFKAQLQNKILCTGKEQLVDLHGCSPREKAAMLYIQSLCSSKESAGEVVFMSHRGSVAASSMRCLTVPSTFDGPDKYISADIIDAYAAHIKSRTHDSRFLCPVWYGSVMADQRRLDDWDKPEQHSFYKKFIRTLFEHDLVFFPLLVKYGRCHHHWILVVMSTSRKLFQILDSANNLRLYKSKVENLINGIARISSMARIAYPNLPNDVATWEVKEIKQVPKQTDRCSCGLYVIKFMEYWNGRKMQPEFEQEDIHLFRKMMVDELIFSKSNEVAEGKDEVGKFMKLLPGGSKFQ